jgi:hypothetical protein
MLKEIQVEFFLPLQERTHEVTVLHNIWCAFFIRGTAHQSAIRAFVSKMQEGLDFDLLDCKALRR